MPVYPVLGLRSLGTLARALSTSTALLSLLETAAEESLLALRAASVSICRLEQDARVLRVLVNVGDLAVSEERFPQDETYALAQWALARQVMTDGITRTACLTDADCDPSERELLEILGKESSVQAAILVDGRMWGEFYATRHAGEDPFAEPAVDYVDVLTAIVGAAISRSVREAELAHLAFHDGLTGALNRQGFDRAASSLFDLLEGTSRVVNTVAVDIDGLKLVNDHHGHARGDQLIRGVAQILHDAVTSYPGSLVSRVGGDEFIVLVPDQDPDRVAARLRAVFSRAVGGWSFGAVAGISAGISSAVLSGRADATLVDLLAAADRALYLAKGRPSPAVVASTELTARSAGSG